MLLQEVEKLSDEEAKEVNHVVMADVWDIVVDWLDGGFRETPMMYPSGMLDTLFQHRPDLFEGRIPSMMQAFKESKITEHMVSVSCTATTGACRPFRPVWMWITLII